MAIHEGARRIVKALSVIAWLVLLLGLVSAFAILFGRERWLSVGFAICGAIAFAVLQGAAWITAGFSGNPREADGLVRWADLWKWRRRRHQNLSITHTAGPTGIGGWLLLLVAGLLVLGPLMAIGKTLQSIELAEKSNPQLLGIAAWQNYKMATWFLLAIAVGISVIAGWRLLKAHEPSSVLIAIIALWVRGPLLTPFDALAANAFLDMAYADYFGDPTLVGEVLGSVFVAVVWTTYLKVSRRVRNTYHHRPYTNTASA